MPSNLDPIEMTPEERLRELAGILARGVLRLRKSRNLSGESPRENLQDSGKPGLAVPANSPLSVVGVSGSRVSR